MPGKDSHYFIRQQIRSYIGDVLKFKIYVKIYPGNNDNQLNINNKLGFNLSSVLKQKIIKNGAFVYFDENIL